MLKRFFAVAMTLVMLLGMVPVAAMAAEDGIAPQLAENAEVTVKFYATTDANGNIVPIKPNDQNSMTATLKLEDARTSLTQAEVFEALTIDAKTGKQTAAENDDEYIDDLSNFTVVATGETYTLPNTNAAEAEIYVKVTIDTYDAVEIEYVPFVQVMGNSFNMGETVATATLNYPKASIAADGTYELKTLDNDISTLEVINDSEVEAGTLYVKYLLTNEAYTVAESGKYDNSMIANGAFKFQENERKAIVPVVKAETVADKITDKYTRVIYRHGRVVLSDDTYDYIQVNETKNTVEFSELTVPAGYAYELTPAKASEAMKNYSTANDKIVTTGPEYTSSDYPIEQVLYVDLVRPVVVTFVDGETKIASTEIDVATPAKGAKDTYTTANIQWQALKDANKVATKYTSYVQATGATYEIVDSKVTVPMFTASTMTVNVTLTCTDKTCTDHSTTNKVTGTVTAPAGTTELTLAMIKSTIPTGHELAEDADLTIQVVRGTNGFDYMVEADIVKEAAAKVISAVYFVENGNDIELDETIQDYKVAHADNDEVTYTELMTWINTRRNDVKNEINAKLTVDEDGAPYEIQEETDRNGKGTGVYFIEVPVTSKHETVTITIVNAKTGKDIIAYEYKNQIATDKYLDLAVALEDLSDALTEAEIEATTDKMLIVGDDFDKNTQYIEYNTTNNTETKDDFLFVSELKEVVNAVAEGGQNVIYLKGQDYTNNEITLNVWLCDQYEFTFGITSDKVTLLVGLDVTKLAATEFSQFLTNDSTYTVLAKDKENNAVYVQIIDPITGTVNASLTIPVDNTHVCTVAGSTKLADQEVNCMQDGYKNCYLCNTCNRVWVGTDGKITESSATHHKTVDVAEIKATHFNPYGTSAGKKCIVCGEITEGCEVTRLDCNKATRVIAAIEPTCTTYGMTEGIVHKDGTTCKGCVASTAIAKLEHVYVTVEGYAATVNNPGMTASVACELCGDVKVAGEVIPAKGMFEDVAEDAWYYDAVEYLNDNRIMNGLTETTFGPEETLTRGMFVTVLYRLAGEPAVASTAKFVDVAADAYWAPAIAWALEKGITNGTSETTFSPERPLSREEMVTFLWRANDKAESTFDLSKYTDVETINDWAATAFAWAVENGYVSGMTETTLEPATPATRAMAAKIAYETK